VEKREPYYTIGGNVNWCKTVWRFLKKLQIELPFDPAIIVYRLFDDGHTGWGKVVPYSGFDLHFSNNE